MRQAWFFQSGVAERLEAASGSALDNITVHVLLLVLPGEENTIWPSWISAERAKQRMEHAGKGDLLEAEVYSGAGPGIMAVGFGTQYLTVVLSPFFGDFIKLGGTPDDTAKLVSKVTLQHSHLLPGSMVAKHRQPPSRDFSFQIFRARGSTTGTGVAS